MIDDVEQVVEFSVSFDSFDQTDGTSLHGSVKITPAEYETAGGSIEALGSVIAVKISEKVSPSA